MAEDPPSQKRVSGKYQDNLGYFRRPHYLRRLRLWAFVGVVIFAVLAVAGFRYWGKDEVFSPGPISANHAHLAQDCRACHEGVETSVFAGLPSEPGRVGSAAFGHSSLASLDAACLRCHPSMDLHLPQASRLDMHAVSSALAVVHATGCATCHREHVGQERIALPDRQSCIDCHNSAEKLRLSPKRVELSHKAIANTGENRDLGDGLMRFLAPSRAVGALQPFSTYADGHPPFAYEDPARRDPAQLSFNHARHLRDDLPKVQGHKLDCADCHQPGPGGIYYQPVQYETHCQQCHSLQIHPDLPNLLVPHGDPEKTRYFLGSLKTTLDPGQFKALKDRGLETLSEFERRIYFEGDPPVGKGLNSSRPGVRKFLTECAKCHTVKPGENGSFPIVDAPRIADRWVQHGPFTHLPHQHVACVDCHAKALSSKDTKDILLPAQTLCVECHRPVATGAVAESDLVSQLPVSIDSNSLAARQAKNGGVKSDCQGCHAFHAPSDAGRILEAK